MVIKFSLLEDESGFTVIELLVVFTIIAIVAAIGIPSFGQLKGQMQSAEEIRLLASNISELRSQAIRLRTNIRINFTNTGYSWDINNDGATEGTRTFDSESNWSGSVPSSVLLNGLGLARGISSQQTYLIENRGQTASVTLNRNGHVVL